MSMIATTIAGAEPSPPEQVVPLSDKRRWRWNPDARCVRLKSAIVVTNYDCGVTLTFPADEAAAIPTFSGISFPFELPESLPTHVANQLIQHGFVILDELLPSHERLIRERLLAGLQRSHGLIVMPTEKCNLRCTYCYESFDKGRMPEQNIEAVRLAIARVSSATKQFGLGFFGGEPLTCSDIILRLSEEAFSQMSKRGLPYAASMSTNGFLLNEKLFGQLLDVGVVSYQISVDGPRQLHDRQRPTAGGGPTFDRIVANLHAMSAHRGSFCCVIRSNVHASDYEQLIALFSSDDFAFMRRDPRFVLDVHTIWSSDRRTVNPEEDASCSAGLEHSLDYYVLNRELMKHGLSTMAYSAHSLLSSGCYAGKPNWFIVGPDLALYKCTVVFDNEANKVGKVNMDGTLTIDSGRNELWTGSNALTDGGCSTCHYRIPCGGIACPLSRFTTGVKSCPEIRSAEAQVRWARGLFPDAKGIGPIGVRIVSE